jgi:ABC-2 type transport system ATP-binding protein
MPDVSETPPAIATLVLTKDYGSHRGIFDLDLNIQHGEVFGFLGPNGAGKTTTIKLLMGMIHPTRGTATIFGLDCEREAVAVKRRVGYVPGETPNFGGWRGSEIVAYVAGLRGGVSGAVISSLAKRLDLDLARRHREYSHGNKQKLLLVLALMHRPPLLILDEPTGGLDPLHQQVFYELVREAREGGTTIFLSSHVLSEVEHVCDRVGIVREGNLVTVGTLAELIGVRARRIEIAFAEDPPLARLRAVPGLDQLEVSGRRVTGILRGETELLLKAIAGQRVVDLHSREPSLEEIFLSYYSVPAPRA